jgi:hypothetical protein
MRPVGAERVSCEVEFLGDHTFVIKSKRGLEVLRHHAPIKLIEALRNPKRIGVELIPRCELIRVEIEGMKIPLRFYMTSKTLDTCSP